MESKDRNQSVNQQAAAQANLRREKQQSIAPRSLALALDLAPVAAVIVALVMLLNPFPRWIDPPPVGVDLTFAQVLAYRSGAMILGATLLVAAVSAGLFRLRWRVTHSRLAQRECPKCEQVVLRRAKRSWYHHLLGLVGIPVYRFACSNCGWHGTRAFK